jgi:hypothetical protein
MPLTHDLAQFLGIKRQQAIDGVLIFLLAEGIRCQPSRRAMSVVARTLGHSGAGNDDYRTTITLHGLRHCVAELLADRSYCPGGSMRATSASKVFSRAAEKHPIAAREVVTMMSV